MKSTVRILLAATLLNVADNSESNGQVAAHAGKHHMDAGILSVLVVNHNVINSNAILTDGDSFEFAAVEAQTLVFLLAEDHWLTVFKCNITLVYQIYHIAPFASGIQEVVLPIFWLSKHIPLTPYAKRIFGPGCSID